MNRRDRVGRDATAANNRAATHGAAKQGAANRRALGIAMVEVLLMLAILATLVSILYPKWAWRRYSVEAIDHLNQMVNGAQLFSQMHAGQALIMPASSRGYSPAMDFDFMCRTYDGSFPDTTLKEFSTDPWRSLTFKPRSGYRFRFNWVVREATDHRLLLAFGEALGSPECERDYAVWRMILKGSQGDLRSFSRAGPFLLREDP